MTPDEVCAYLKINKDWLYDQVQARRIPHVRLGRQLRFWRSELIEFLASRAVTVESTVEPDCSRNR